MRMVTRIILILFLCVPVALDAAYAQHAVVKVKAVRGW